MGFSRGGRSLDALEPARQESLKESEVAQETAEKEGTHETRSRTLCHLVPFSWQSLMGLFLSLLLPLALPIFPEESWASQSQCYCNNIYHIKSGKEEAWEAGPGRRQETWELLWFNLFFCFIFKNPLCKDIWSPSF